MNFDAKSEILKAISLTDDQTMKTILLLLLGVVEEIGGKIDRVVNNEKAMRTMVLNGHEAVHHKHHEWLAHRIDIDEDVRNVMAWTKNKMAEERNNQDSSRKIKDSLVIEVLKYVIIGALGATIGSWLF